MPALIFKVFLKLCGSWGHQVTQAGCRLQQKAITKPLLNQQTAADFGAGFTRDVACLFQSQRSAALFKYFSVSSRF